MKKALAIILSVILWMCVISACATSSSKTYIFAVDNGDKIRVELNTTENYDLTADLPFMISCDGKVLSQGVFVSADTFQQYVNVVNTDKNAEIIDVGIKSGNEYIFWCYNQSEYNYAILINGSNTGIIIGNSVSEEAAKECFNRLTIAVEESTFNLQKDNIWCRVWKRTVLVV